MKVGIVGYSGTGKTTIFAALTGQEVRAGVPGEKHLGSVEVIDRRLDRLRDVFTPKKFTRARFDVEDEPSIPRGDLKGKGELLQALREPDALLLVIGHFEQAHLGLGPTLADPTAQLQALRDDLLLLDLELVERRGTRLEERRKKGGADRAALEREREFVQRVGQALEDGRPLAVAAGEKEEQRILGEMRLFTPKPTVVVFNVEEAALRDAGLAGRLHALFPCSAVLCGPVEQEIAQIAAEERAEFLAEYGLEQPASERLTRLAYEALDLIAFFTVGPDEVRAWPLPRGSDAVTAAGRIHTDLARGFIRAEVIPHASVAQARDLREFKSSSRMELKGKDYVVEDGDILNIRFNV